MICPKCKANLQGELIYETFLRQYKNEEQALKVAELYGATKETGWWGRQIAQYDDDLDRTVAYQCPDCGHTWDRGKNNEKTS